jgi:hypothetical protein
MSDTVRPAETRGSGTAAKSAGVKPLNRRFAIPKKVEKQSTKSPELRSPPSRGGTARKKVSQQADADDTSALQISVISARSVLSFTERLVQHGRQRQQPIRQGLDIRSSSVLWQLQRLHR